VLSLLGLAGPRPSNLEALLAGVGYDPASLAPAAAWYEAEGGWPALPVGAEPAALEAACRKLRASAARRGVRLADASAAVVFEGRFNELVAATGSKASCAWRFVAGHLRAIWEGFGEHAPRVVVDRQSGRRYYGDLLEAEFAEAEVVRVEEGATTSLYQLASGGRSMEVLVSVGSEAVHFPAACASMLAKYVRELLMLRFQRFWSERAPLVRPTFGYFGDGRRFLRELEPYLAASGIDPASLARRC
jgi:hypothetical protein